MNQTLGSLVAARPALAPVFENLGIDFCCGGHRTLEEAARDRGLDPHTLAFTIAAFPAIALTEPAPASNPALLPTPQLIDYIIATHHSYVKRELPRLISLAAKVAQAHGPGHPELLELDAGVAKLSETLLCHLNQEEAALFPALRNLGPGKHPALKESLSPYFEEHEEAGGLLLRFRELTNGFAHTDWACNTYRALMDGLMAFEIDLHRHVHLENNVLFTRLS